MRRRVGNFHVLAVHVEKDVGVVRLELRKARQQPEFRPVGVRGDVHLVDALEIEYPADRVELSKPRAQVRQRRFEFARRPNARPTAHEQVEAEVILERLDTLPQRRGSDGECGGRSFQRALANRQLQRLQGTKMGGGSHPPNIKIFFTTIKNI